MDYDPNMKTLVVDDMRAMVMMISKMLKELGFIHLESAEDGGIAWKMILKAKEEGAPFDLIVSDWNMPNMSGLELLERIRSSNGLKTLPFLMITAECEKDKIIQVVKAGVSNFITKPFTQENLEAKINAIYKVKDVT